MDNLNPIQRDAYADDIRNLLMNHATLMEAYEVATLEDLLQLLECNSNQSMV
jgi:hypothetical protein